MLLSLPPDSKCQSLYNGLARPLLYLPVTAWPPDDARSLQLAIADLANCTMLADRSGANCWVMERMLDSMFHSSLPARLFCQRSILVSPCRARAHACVCVCAQHEAWPLI